MEVIRWGLQEGLDVKLYANPELSFLKMGNIFQRLIKYKNLL